MRTGRLVVGITGASGALIAQRFVRHAVRRYDEVFLIASRNALDVARTELGVAPGPEELEAWLGEPPAKVRLLQPGDLYTPPASGSFEHDGMVILPCSMGTAGRIASGVSDDLTTRAADVCLKERRPLILVPRETPWNLIMLRNLTALAEAGAVVLPACPAWYGRPQSPEDLADTVVARILQQLGVGQDLVKPWMSDE